MRSLRFALPAALVMAFALAPSVSAAAQPVTIDLHVEFGGPESFTATGFCTAGTAVTYNFAAVGGGRAITFHLYKDLTCDDGSGTLTIRVEAVSVFGTPGTIGGWSVVGGTGAYAATRGGGSIVGIGFDGGIDDMYAGRLSG